MTTPAETTELDATNLLCPMPVIRVQQTIKTLTPGAILTVRCTDPGTQQDIPSWCRVHGHELIDCSTAADEFHFKIRVCE